MKSCAECQSPAPDALLACSACGCGIFTEPDTPKAGKRVDSDFVALLKWAAGYVLSAMLIGVVTSIATHVLWRNGFRAAAEGMATSPIMLVPLLTMVVFAVYSSRYRNPIAHAGALYLAISVLGLGVHLLGSGRPSEYIAAAVSTLVFALVGTAIAFAFRRRNDEA
jgi:fumarate reductase subunit D